MKRTVWIAALFLVSGMAVAALAQQASSNVSLGDAARRARASRPASAPVRVYTNDNLPTQGSISTNTAGTLAKDSSSASSSGDAAAAGDKSDAPAPGDDLNARAKVEQEWRKKIGDQKSKVEQLQKQVEDLDRQMRMQGTINAMGSAGCLQDQKKCDDAMKAYQDQMNSKKQDLQAAQDKLDGMREELRRAGLPGSWGD